MGGWIITYSKKYFCHDGKDGSCFDKYCNKEKQCQDTMEKKMKKPMGKKKWIKKKAKMKEKVQVKVKKNIVKTNEDSSCC